MDRGNQQRPRYAASLYMPTSITSRAEWRSMSYYRTRPNRISEETLQTSDCCIRGGRKLGSCEAIPANRAYEYLPDSSRKTISPHSPGIHVPISVRHRGVVPALLARQNGPTCFTPTPR